MLTGAIVLSMHRAAATRAELLSRACHELRGPISAIGLGVALCARTGTLPPERLRAIELELGRASIALDDLALGRRRQARRRLLVALGSLPRDRHETTEELVDLVALLEDSVEAWRAAARIGRFAWSCRRALPRRWPAAGIGLLRHPGT